jgi:hypothetical protein
MAAVPGKGGAVWLQNVAEHARDGSGGLPPGDQLKRGRVRDGDHVAFFNSAKSFQRRAVETHALLEGRLQFAGQDLKALQGSKHIHKPELDQLDLVLAHGFDDIVGIFAIEDRIFGHGVPPQQGDLLNEPSKERRDCLVFEGDLQNWKIVQGRRTTRKGPPVRKWHGHRRFVVTTGQTCGPLWPPIFWPTPQIAGRGTVEGRPGGHVPLNAWIHDRQWVRPYMLAGIGGTFIVSPHAARNSSTAPRPRHPSG